MRFKTLEGQDKYRVYKKDTLDIEFIDKFFSQQQQNKNCWSKSYFPTVGNGCRTTENKSHLGRNFMNLNLKSTKYGVINLNNC